jgi:hypothetical protein
LRLTLGHRPVHPRPAARLEDNIRDIDHGERDRVAVAVRELLRDMDQYAAATIGTVGGVQCRELSRCPAGQIRDLDRVEVSGPVICPELLLDIGQRLGKGGARLGIDLGKEPVGLLVFISK